jgi:hypothetical protein
MISPVGRSIGETEAMARGISIYRKSDLDFIASPPQNVVSDEFDRWYAESEAKCLFEAALGSEGAMREFWSDPASRLGLPLIADIYEQGFTNGIKWSDAQLSQVEQETLYLQEHWSHMSFSDELKEDLRTRVEDLQKAIAVAQEHDGVLTIS